MPVIPNEDFLNYIHFVMKLHISHVPARSVHDTCVIDLRSARISCIPTKAAIRTDLSIQAVTLT